MRIGYMVDVQNDFMKTGGALYIEDAEKLFENIQTLNKLFEEKDIPVWASADAHDPHSKELARNGGVWPDHCMKGAYGKELCEESGYIPQLTLSPLESDAGLHVSGYRAKAGFLHHNLLLEKDENDIFSHAPYNYLFEALGLIPHPNEREPVQAIVYGVATDYCVKDAVLGMRKRGIEVLLVTDAIKEVTPETGKEALALMCKAGAREVTTNQLLDLLK